MSLIIVSTDGILPPDSLIENSFEANDGGWGLVFPNTSTKLHVVKGEQLDSLLKNIPRAKNLPFMIHMQKGKWVNGKLAAICDKDIQPHKYCEGGWVAIDDYVNDVFDMDETKSNAYNFAANLYDFYKEYPEYASSADFHGYVERWLGSKVAGVLIKSVGCEISLLNADLWTEYQGLLLSRKDWTDETIASKVVPITTASKSTFGCGDKVPLESDSNTPKDGEIIVYSVPHACDWCTDHETDLYHLEGQEICKSCYVFSQSGSMKAFKSNDTTFIH